MHRGDIDIRENKVYRKRPMLIAEDGPVQEFRRWFAGFYPGEADAAPSHAQR